MLDKHAVADVMAERSPGAAKTVRDTLLFLVPPHSYALGVLVALSAVTWWVTSQFSQSLEAMVLPRRGWLGGVTAFDLLFRFGLLAMIGLTVWAVYRLVRVWSGIRTILEEIDPDLTPAFVDLPPRIAKISRLTPFGYASRVEINELADQKWAVVCDSYGRLPKRSKQTLKAAGIVEFAERPQTRNQPFELGCGGIESVTRLHRAVEYCRSQGWLAKQTHADSPDGEGKETRRKVWARRCSEMYALLVADYVDWVLQHMRYLASFVLVALVLTLLLLSSYPFQPQSAVNAVFSVVFMVGVITILYIVTAMNRDRVLSAIANTQAGTVNWDSHFITAIATYGALPLVTFISTVFPQVRDFLFSWVAPLLRALTKG
jgi:hypothetical protein